MKLFCKELKGNEIALDNLNEDTLISEVKKQIETELGIPGEFLEEFLGAILLNFFSHFFNSCSSKSTKAVIFRQNTPRFIEIEGVQNTRQC